MAGCSLNNKCIGTFSSSLSRRAATVNKHCPINQPAAAAGLLSILKSPAVVDNDVARLFTVKNGNYGKAITERCS